MERAGKPSLAAQSRRLQRGRHGSAGEYLDVMLNSQAKSGRSSDSAEERVHRARAFGRRVRERLLSGTEAAAKSQPQGSSQ